MRRNIYLQAKIQLPRPEYCTDFATGIHDGHVNDFFDRYLTA